MWLTVPGLRAKGIILSLILYDYRPLDIANNACTDRQDGVRASAETVRFGKKEKY